MMWGYGFGWPMMFFMFLVTVLCIALLVAFVWGLVRWLNRRNGMMYPYQSTLPAMELLRQRFARGEIDAATFERMKAQLEESEAERTTQYQHPLV